MIYIYSILIVALSSLLWRIRGGLWKEYIPANKIWYAVAFAVYGCFYFSFGFENFIVGLLAAYASYQCFGWGLYVGRLISGGTLNPNLIQYRECELIDDLLYSLHITYKGTKYYLYQYPRAFGFVGTTLIGVITTFLWGLYLGNLGVMVSGLAMGVCYWLGYLLNKVYPERKGGWGYGEILAGMWFGVVLAWGLLW